LSTNGLAVDLGGRLDVYGTTITVGNLQNGISGGGFIANSSGASNGTLIVGTDGTSTAFDGVFGNGGSQPLNLTKVGAGTLTLSGVSTNTGVVTVDVGSLALTGSGSFANASKLVANATLDVSGIGGTLTLSSGQTLGGNGTVAGNVVAPVGSAVSPGSSIGTLTVAGNINLSGTLLMELNRTNAPSNCDQLTNTSGTITYGGDLVVSNIGPSLVAGDTFQLFPSAVSGFASVSLPATNDLGYAYSWTNKVAVNGSIQLLSVIIPPPPVDPTPTNIVSSVGGGNLTLSWPSSHIGWTLQAQTNSRSIGLSNNWVTFDGGYMNTNNVVIPMGNSQPTVFFRLFYQVP
jgi:autotransporter-associated beta strand protein